MSKISSKLVQIVIYFVQFFSVIFNKIQFVSKVNNLNNYLNYGCFSHDDFNSAISLYVNFISNLSTDNNTVLALLFTSLFFDICVCLSYFLIWHSEYSTIVEKNNQEEKKRKEYDLISNALKEKNQ